MATRTIVALIALGLALAACGSDDSPAEQVEPAATTATPVGASPPASVGPAEGPTPSPEETSTGQPDATESSTVSPAPASPRDPVLPIEVDLELAPLVQLDQPLDLVPRAGSDSLYVATRPGQVIEIAVEGTDGRVVDELINVSSLLTSARGEQGLLGLVFSPDGDALYLNYTNVDGDTRVDRWQMNGDRVDTESRVNVIGLDQPEWNHNGGDLAFGPDGLLYIAVGDGGGSRDQFRTGQDPSSLLGTILRVDPQSSGGYRIPADNPFVESGGAPEIFIWGARNPWRISFDRSTGDLWIGDVGQDAVEEVDVLFASEGGGRGVNLGWSDVEGSAPMNASQPPSGNYVGPVYEYLRRDGCAVTGGHVYRGSAIPGLWGTYLFADWCTAALWGIVATEANGLLTDRIEFGPSVDNGISSFGEDADGEVYVLSFDGFVYKIVER